MTAGIQLGMLAIAAAGILIIVGARKLGWRVLAVGVILIIATTALTPQKARQGDLHVAAQ